jgi:hypothetical protein
VAFWRLAESTRGFVGAGNNFPPVARVLLWIGLVTMLENVLSTML